MRYYATIAFSARTYLATAAEYNKFRTSSLVQQCACRVRCLDHMSSLDSFGSYYDLCPVRVANKADQVTATGAPPAFLVFGLQL